MSSELKSLRCQFCDKEFKSKNSLEIHQKNTKSCLIKQGKINIVYKCNYCEKILSTNNRLNTHMNICREKLIHKNQEYKSNIEEYKSKIKEESERKDNYIDEFKLKIKEQQEELDKFKVKIKEQQEELDKFKLKINDKEEYISKLEEMLRIANNAIVDIAKQPKNIHQTNMNSNNRIRTQNNIQNNFDIDDIQKITNVLENHLTPEVLCKGQKGVAEMLKQHLLQTENGEPLYECTDVSRQKFEFVNKDGIIEIDSKASKLITSLNKANIYDKAHSTGQKLWEKEDGSVDYQAQNVHMPKVTEVLEINQDSSKLRSHLASITCR